MTLKDAAKVLGYSKSGLRYYYQKLPEELRKVDERGNICITEDALEELRNIIDDSRKARQNTARTERTQTASSESIDAVEPSEPHEKAREVREETERTERTERTALNELIEMLKSDLATYKDQLIEKDRQIERASAEHTRAMNDKDAQINDLNKRLNEANENLRIQEVEIARLKAVEVKALPESSSAGRTFIKKVKDKASLWLHRN